MTKTFVILFCAAFAALAAGYGLWSRAAAPAGHASPPGAVIIQSQPANR